MLALINKEDNAEILFNDIDEIQEYIKELEIHVDTTTPMDWIPNGYVYDPYEDENWERTIKDFDFEIEEI